MLLEIDTPPFKHPVLCEILCDVFAKFQSTHDNSNNNIIIIIIIIITIVTIFIFIIIIN